MNENTIETAAEEVVKVEETKQEVVNTNNNQDLNIELVNAQKQIENLNKALKLERENKKQIKQNVEQVNSVASEQDSKIAELLERLEKADREKQLESEKNAQNERLKNLDVDLDSDKNKMLIEALGIENIKNFEDEKLKSLFEIKKSNIKEKEEKEEIAGTKNRDKRLDTFIKNMAKAEGISEAEAEKKLNEMF